MNMLEKDGGLFEGYNVKVVESHQSEKSSTPGTAVSIAQSLGVDPNAIISVRDKEQQLQELKIPKEHLDRHAFHRIKIEDDVCSILMETSVYGSAPYAKGVAKT